MTEAEREYLNAQMEMESTELLWKPEDSLVDAAMYEVSVKRLVRARNMVKAEKAALPCDKCGTRRVALPATFDIDGVVCPKCPKERR
jgi:formylmethanofuran dehydrogenase subunit E